MGNIEIIDGDIIKANVDAIVNAVNPKMLAGGGVHSVPRHKLLQQESSMQAILYMQ